MPYKKVMKILARAKMFNEPGHGWRLIRINPSHEELLKRLDNTSHGEAATQEETG
jgi:hypothetical protein